MQTLNKAGDILFFISCAVLGSTVWYLSGKGYIETSTPLIIMTLSIAGIVVSELLKKVGETHDTERR